ncbi:MAG: hypothetical protein AAB937_00510 [Patescibacteria group bacterium]
MNILTFFDKNKIRDGWQSRVEQKFSQLPDTHFTHVDSLADAISHMQRNDERSIIVFGLSDGKHGAWTNLIPHIKSNYIPIVLTGDLDKYFYSETFRKQTGRAPRILDTVNFYRDIEVLMKFLKEQFSHSSGEYKE